MNRRFLCQTGAIALLSLSIAVSMSCGPSAVVVDNAPRPPGPRPRGVLPGDVLLASHSQPGPRPSDLLPPGAANRAAAPGPTSCKVKFDNRSRWRVQAYIDKRFLGLVPRFKTVSTRVAVGTSELAGVAEAADGTLRVWRQRLDCTIDTTFRWQLGE